MDIRKSEFIDNMVELVMIEEPDSIINYANKAFCDYYGMPEAEVIGRRLLDFIIPEDRHGCDMEGVVSPEHPEYRVEGRTIKANGEVAWIQIVGKGIFDAEGKLAEFQEIALDITEWKEKIEKNVKALERKNNQITKQQSSSLHLRERASDAKRLGNIALYTFDDVVTRNSNMISLIEQAKVVARGNSAILIEGESGTGKELFAQAIHNSSMRANGPFVAVNCGAISHELLQSELFGYVEGAFTGASKEGRPGKFEMANIGTIFLDEIGEMSLEQQVALLRVIETKIVTRIGSNKNIPIDVRIICATNKDLYRAMCDKKFRKDLYFRLNVINLYIPPLRERKDDIYPLARKLIEAFEPDSNRAEELTEERLNIMYQYSWPGNIRELRNIVERILYVPNYDINQLLRNEKSFYERNAEDEYHIYTESPDNKNSEKDIIEAKIKDCRGNISQVAKEMGYSRKTIYKYIKKYDIKHKKDIGE